MVADKAIKGAVGDHVTSSKLEALLRRRKLLPARLDGLIARKGPEAVILAMTN